MLVKSHYIRILRKCAESFPEVLRGLGRVNTSSTQKSCREAPKKMFPDNYPRCFFSWLWKITCFSCQSIYTWTIFHSYLDL
jgi:hypothetical protein